MSTISKTQLCNTGRTAKLSEGTKKKGGSFYLLMKKQAVRKNFI